MKRVWFVLIFLGAVLSVFQSTRAQSDEPLALVMTADGPIMPPMYEYIQRGVEVAELRNAEVLIIQLNTPGGSIDTLFDIVEIMGSSNVPVVIYVAPRDSQAASAGALVTMAGHAAAMAPRTIIGAASPIDMSGSDIESTLQKKIKEDLKAKAQTLVERRGEQAVQLSVEMIDDAKAVTADGALEAGMIDFIVDNVDDLLEALDGFTVQMDDGPRTLDTSNAHTEALDMSFIEQLLLFLTNPNIVFSLFSLGTMAILFEISSPGGWVSGFVGVVCVTLSIYGMGVLPINGFGAIFLVTAFVLFILDIKAPTHGALTAAGVASFIIGALVLFNSPSTPDFQRVSVPLIFGVGVSIGLLFFAILVFALSALRAPISMGAESMIGKTGSAKTWEGSHGQVQMQSELWSAESIHDSDKINKGDNVEVVEVQGLRLKVRKK